jgi:hypothetical protein
MRLANTALRGLLAATALAAAAAAGAARAETNVVPTAVGAVTIDGTYGVLHSATWSGPPSTASDPLTPIDGVFAPENQQWNDGSFWWDEDPSINATPLTYTLDFNGLYELDRFVVQADDNDTYLLEWWDGAAWQTAFNVPGVFTYGLTTRDSGVLAPIVTDRLRFSATGGDNYYGVSEIQAFGTAAAAAPEPAAWAMMIAGFGLAGALLRRRRGLDPNAPATA